MFFNEQDNLQIFLSKTHLLNYSNGKNLYLGTWQHSKYFLQHFSRSSLELPSEKCEVSSLGLELPGLGLGFNDKFSVSKFQPGLGLGGYGLDYITVPYYQP